MTAYEKFIAALNIFAKYDHKQSIVPAHDQVFAGPDPEDVSPEDLETLASLGWYPDLEGMGFYTFL